MRRVQTSEGKSTEQNADTPGGSASGGGLGRWSERGPAAEQEPDGRLAQADQEGKRVLKQNLQHINLTSTSINLYRTRIYSSLTRTRSTRTRCRMYAIL